MTRCDAQGLAHIEARTMIDIPKLARVANAPGYGTGAAFRNKAIAASEALALLPLPRLVNHVVAGTDMGPIQVPLCHFGFSGEDKRDWQIFLDAEDCDLWALGSDAMLDAQTVAAIINAYRIGLIVRADTRAPPKVKPLVFEDRGILECTAVVSFGTYHVQWDDEVQSWYASLELGEHENPIILEPSDCASDHDAKTVAQADYKRRILEALE